MTSRFSLRTKFIAGSVALVLLTGAALTLFILVEVHDRLEEEIHKRGITIARHLAESSVNPILTENLIRLQLLINDYRKNEEDIRYIYIVNDRKEVLAHTFGKSFPSDLLKMDNVVATTKTEFAKRLQTDEGLLYDIPSMIQNGELGQVHVGISEAVIHKNLQNVLNHLFFYVAVILCLGSIVAVLFAATITKPIAILAAGVKRVGRGELDGLIDIESQDEIGQLAESFNTMIENLRQTTVSREFMDKLINTMNDALLVVSPDGVIQSVNRAFGELFGYDQTLLAGRRADGFAEHEAPHTIYGMFEYALREGRVQGIERVCCSTSGNLIPVLFSLAVMHDEQGTLQAVICAAQDISGIKRVQETLEQKQAELVELNQGLEDTVAFRTAELAVTNAGLRAEVAERQRTAEELRVARDAAENANRAKTDFLANMSHEMRTPLNSIIGGAEYLEDAPLTRDQSRCLDMIRQAGNNLLVLVKDLIDLSRIEARHLELVPRDFILADTLENIIQMLNSDADRKNLEFSHSVAHDLPRSLVGDEARLQQVLVNLIGNAIKFTDAGSVTVSVFGGALAGNVVPVTFVVRDTGIGIESDKVGMIFETFAQADSSITRRYGGSGLGLAISRRLVEAMGGHLQVESVPGVGSSFSFVVPLAVSSAKRDQGEFDRPSSEIGKSCQDDPQTEMRDDLPLVLLVDDSLENRALMRLLLVKLALVLHEAGNGREALDMFEQNAYALVLMDIQMPVMDGYTATRLMRGIEARTGRARTPIVALTAHTYEEDIHASVEAGCDDHIAKPFRKKTLIDCLERYLNGVLHG